MNLALVTHNVIPGDGQGRVNMELTRYLLDRDVEVTLIANQVDDTLLNRGAEWIQIDTGALGEKVDLIKVWRFKRKADRLVRHIGDRFDAILACGVVCSVPHTINAVHFAHGQWLHSPYHSSRMTNGLNRAYQWLFTWINARWELQTLRNAERVVAVSDMVRDELVSCGLAEDTIEVIVNGVDLDTFAPGPADRPALGLPANVPLGLFVGDIESPIKNIDGVLRGLAEVSGIHLAVAGALDHSPYPELARDLGVDDRVHFLGFRQDIPELMRAADFFTLPSRRDSCPLVLLEALASGLPVITSTGVGTANLITDDTGFVMQGPDDFDTLTHGLQTLAYDDDQRAAMSRAARRTAEQHGWDDMSERYFQLVQEMTMTTPEPTTLK